MRIRSRALRLGAVFALVGCNDPTAPVGDLEPSAVATSSGTPSEFDQPAYIDGTTLDAGFDPNAYAMARMTYYGNRATIDLALTVRQGSSIYSSQTRSGSAMNTVPWRHTFAVSAYLPVPKECGHNLQAYADYAAWHEYQGYVWSHQFRQEDRIASQPACTSGSGGGGDDDPGSGGGGGGGGGDNSWMCDEYRLEPGCYDVYVDGQYQGTVCC